jgi:hypothetical protein
VSRPFPGYSSGRLPGHSDLDDTTPCLECGKRVLELEDDGRCESCSETTVTVTQRATRNLERAAMVLAKEPHEARRRMDLHRAALRFASAIVELAAEGES